MTTTKYSILIVDDEEDLREAMAFDFKRKGFEVRTAANGLEAFQTVEKESLDLVLTDARMPNGDGIELLGKVRQRNPSHPPVILVTGFADITLEQAYAHGCDAVFGKPFDRRALFEQVQRSILPLIDRLKHIDGHQPVKVSLGVTPSKSQRLLSHQTVSFGRCGIYCEFGCALDTSGIFLGEKVEFGLDADFLAPRPVAGRGIVRWARTLRENVFGCGIEILSLNDDCRDAVAAYLQSLNSKAVIPQC